MRLAVEKFVRDCWDRLRVWVRESAEIRQRLFAFIEQPLVLTAIGTIAGILGALFYAPILFLCGACVVLGFHRAKVVHGLSISWRVISYLIVVVVTIAVLYGLQRLIREKLQEADISISTLIAKTVVRLLPAAPTSTPGPTPTQIPALTNQPRVPSPQLPKPNARPTANSGFSVDIENRIFTLPGPYGTSFWFGTFFFSECSLEPTGAAIFLRITNLQQQKEMITAYSIDGLPKIQVPHGRMFIILPKGQITSGYVPHVVDFGAPAGIGAFVHFPVEDADTSKAIPVTGDFLDYKIGEGHYLETDESVRGWIFAEYRKGYTEIPAHLTIKITDQFQQSFTYPIPDHVGDPNGDILPRRIVEGALEDLSRCSIVK